MTAITVTEYSREDLPITVLNGTAKKRARIYLRFTAATVDETLDLTSIDANITDIEGIVYSTDDGAVTSTVPTWSTYTLTTKMAGVEEICLNVVY